jgi:hypothetical protein
VKRALIVATVILFVSHLYAGQQKTPDLRQQASFCEDGPDETVLKPIPLPSEVVSALMYTAEANAARESAENKGRNLNPATLFKGTTVHLAKSVDVFYLVMGSFPMSGADNTWFWIVRSSGNGATILLWAGANCVDISRKGTLGYKDIVTTWSSARYAKTTIYKYSGRSYKVWRTKSRPVSW